MTEDEDAQGKGVWTVSELTRRIRNVLEWEVGRVGVEGEISNYRLLASGHAYFTLKDEAAQLNCVLFRGQAGRVGCRLADGRQVRLFGEITVYEPRGVYQMVVQRGEEKGAGDLHARFEALKQVLLEEGLFEEERKKPLPAFPDCVALLTSGTGAALQDMLRVFARRAPWIRIVLYPVRVQGEGAWRETAQALKRLGRWKKEKLPRADVIVVGRGGGSLEDLWNYNEEGLARAVAACPIPVVSAVGHETDFTIVDFVSDLRAPTPSAAAELIAPDGGQLREHLRRLRVLLEGKARRSWRRSGERLGWAARDSRLSEPLRRLRNWIQRLDDLGEGMRTDSCRWLERSQRVLAELEGYLRLLAPARRLADGEERLRRIRRALPQAANRGHLLRARDVEGLEKRLRALGPEATLARGFSIVKDASGEVIRRAGQAQVGDPLQVLLHRGRLEVSVHRARDEDEDD
ncbi:MAG TPA: exodeoxyribonuclease VII large subunit [Verrucomicrobiales bacterium]|nr:exodeoxyribonuclease VII large subunit [Verrucomicrobiales bacterium]